MKQNLIRAGLVIVLIAAITGGYYFPKTQEQQAIGSPIGTSFSTAKLTAINMTPVSATATSSSVLNTDVSDRYVLDAYIECSGITGTVFSASGGVATWQWQAATTSTSAPANLDGRNLAMSVTVATSSTLIDAYSATSTYTGVFLRRWAAGSYMTFWTNATSSAATCQPGLHYISL